MDYLKVNEKGKYEKQFSLNPFVQLNDQMGNVPEPSTKHFWDRDIFTHITYADLNNLDSASQEESREPDTLYMNVGDSVFISNSILRFKSLLRNVEKDSLDLLADDIALGINIEAQTLDGKTYQASPIMVIRGNRVFSIDDEIEELGVKISFSGVKPEVDKLEILISEKNKNAGDFVIMQALVFPYINVLWIGCIIMVLGTLVAAINRFQSRQKKDK